MYIYMQAEFVTDYSPGYCPGLCHVRPPAYILFKNFYNNELSIVNLFGTDFSNGKLTMDNSFASSFT